MKPWHSNDFFIAIAFSRHSMLLSQNTLKGCKKRVLDDSSQTIKFLTNIITLYHNMNMNNIHHFKYIFCYEIVIIASYEDKFIYLFKQINRARTYIKDFRMFIRNLLDLSLSYGKKISGIYFSIIWCE